MILLAGDSWSAGEWDASRGEILHKGVAQYLHDAGHHVINLGQPGGWNGLSVSRLDSFLRLNTFINDKISHILIFQTEWIRDFAHKDTYSTFEYQDLEHNYLDLKNRIISRFYSRLTELAIKYNKIIHVIGGVSDAIWLDRFSDEYPGVTIACQSWTNLVLNQNHRIETPIYSLFSRMNIESIAELKQHYSTKDFDLLLDDIDSGTARMLRLEHCKEFFWPDGGHPNRQGHRVLYDFLVERIL
jgi:lysophospholipase L1-like esterase